MWFTSWRRVWLFALVAALLFILTAGRFESYGRARAVWSPQGHLYYVAPTGDDSNEGTIAQPWQTIQKAANTLIASLPRTGAFRPFPYHGYMRDCDKG